MRSPVAILRFLLLALAASVRTLVDLPARGVAAVDRWMVARAPAAVAGSGWLLVLVLGHLADRRPSALAAFALLLLIVLLLVA